MAAPQRLQSANVSPAARPVDTFMSFDENSQPAAPGRPQSMPAPKGIVAFQRGAQRSVQGVNPFEELASALKPLSKLYDSGVELYASDQYRQGQNEMLKAAASIGRDQVIKGLQYAEDNRQLSRENPIAGILMDESNPFRAAGRRNQASKWVGSIIPQVMRAEWAARGGDLGKLDPTDPAVLAVQADVTQRLTGAFGLDEFDPGFQKHVVPQINRSWEWFQTQQNKAHVAYEKDVGVRQTSKAMLGLLMKPEAIDEQWNELLVNSAAQFGITGEPERYTREAVLGTVKLLQKAKLEPGFRDTADALIERLVDLPSGIVDADGKMMTVGEAFSDELFDASVDFAKDMKTLRDLEDEQIQSDVEDYLAEQNIIDLNPEDLPGLLAQLQQKFPDATQAQLLQILGGQVKGAREFNELSFNTEVVEDFLAGQEALLGDNWDEKTARNTFEALIQNAPPKVKQRLRKEFNSLVSRKGDDGTAGVNQSVLTAAVNDGSSLIAEALFPGEGLEMMTAAEELGLSLTDYLAGQKTSYAQALISAKAYIRNEALKRIRAERASTGEDVNPGRQGVIVTDVINELVQNPDKLKQFVPKSVREKSQKDENQGQQPRRQGGPDRSRSAKPEQEEPPTKYNPSQQIPEQVATSGAILYEQKDLLGLLATAANNKPLPGAVKRAAKANGMTTGEFLLNQAEKAGVPIPEGMRKKVEKVARVETGVEESLAQAAPNNRSPLAVASNVLLNVLTGTGPAIARQRSVPVIPYEGESPVRVNPNTQYIATTGFGMSADGQTQTLHGIVGRVGYDANHGVGNDHIHHGAPDKQTALALANYLKNNGVPIWEFAPWGPVAPVHQDPGHYNGMSFDIPVGVEEHDRVLRLIDNFYRTR